MAIPTDRDVCSPSFTKGRRTVIVFEPVPVDFGVLLPEITRTTKDGAIVS